MTASETAKLESELSQFYGTEHYYRTGPYPAVCTDGVKWLAECAKCYWLLDICGIANVLPPEPGLCFNGGPRQSENQGFQVWRIRCSDAPHGGRSAVVDCWTDTPEESTLLYRQSIPHTDFPFDNFTFWYENGVMLLPSEH